MNSYADFVKGRFSGVALDRDGRLTLAPKLDTVFTSGQSIIWSVAQAPDGSVYLGTGHRGRIYKVDKAGVSSLIWSAEQPEVFALAVNAQGVVYAATSPDGKIFRIENGKATEFFAPKAKYIWSLAFGKDGALYAGAGEPGDIYRIEPSGAGELYYESGQGHITSLAVDGAGNLLAGSEPNGLVYRVTAKNKAFVLYDANLPEIRAIVPAADGGIYVAALGGALANRSGPLTNLLSNSGPVVVATQATSVTVTESAQAGPEIKPKIDTPKPTGTGAQTVATAATTQVELPGVEKSALYRVNTDGTVETLWSSKDENAYSLALEKDGNILLSTDAQGRIYRLDANRKPALLAQTNEGEATRLLESAAGILAATGDTGRLYRLQEKLGQSTATGTYEAPVHDSTSIARWGRISWRSRGGAVKIETRSGNSSRPDNTWSDWSEPLTDAEHSAVKSPNARFLQWRAELSGVGTTVENVSVAYLPQNNAPNIRSISVTSLASATASTKAVAASSTAAYTVTVTDTGDAANTSSGTPPQTISRATTSQIQVSWQADDPDSDRLVYSLYFRGDDEREWKLLRANMSENTLLLDGDIFADGRYYFRVVASDRPSNAAQYAREADQVSALVFIDNTPPVVKLSAPRRAGAKVEFDVNATDQTSALRRCEYAVDAGPWLPVEAADGVTDSPSELFHIVLDKVGSGEHLVTVRVTDTAGNAGLAKAVVRP